MNLNEDKDKYSWFDTSNYLRKIAEDRHIPLIGAFEITARCNLACKMCYIRREGTKEVIKAEKSAEEWINLGEQAAESGTLFLLITGGEPLIRPDFRVIYESLNKMGFIITLYTNATLIDEDFIRWISKIPPNKVGITLYGASPETYRRVTGDINGFHKALRGLDLLLEAGIKVHLRTTITHGNIADIGAMDSIAEKRNIEINHVYSLTKYVRGAYSDVEKERLTPIEIRDINKDKIIKKNDGGTIYKSKVNPLKSNYEAMFCAAGKSSYWVSWDGKMLPCAMMNYPYSDPFESGFAEAWEDLRQGIQEIKGPEECIKCEDRQYCGVCPAKLQAETGSFEKVSPYICESAKLAREIYCQTEEK